MTDYSYLVREGFSEYLLKQLNAGRVGLMSARGDIGSASVFQGQRDSDDTADVSYIYLSFGERIFDIESKLTELAIAIEALREGIQARPNKYNVWIRDLGDENYVLTDALLITVEEYFESDGYYVATFPELELFSEGVTEAEAILALKMAILDLYDELTEDTPESLGELPRSWLRVLKAIIRK